MMREPDIQTESQRSQAAQSGWLITAVALAGAFALGYYWRRSRPNRLSSVGDSAPRRTEKRAEHNDYVITGKTVTINCPREQIYRFWRDFSNLPSFMENVLAVTLLDSKRSHWSIAGPAGTTVDLRTEIVEEQENQLIRWHALESSDVEAHGSVRFWNAPGNRGTQVEAIVAYKPPGGEVGRWIAKLFQREPAVQGRRELKRLKMLLETGEIATSRNCGSRNLESELVVP